LVVVPVLSESVPAVRAVRLAVLALRLVEVAVPKNPVLAVRSVVEELSVVNCPVTVEEAVERKPESQLVPLAVKLVVLAPPFAEKRPEVTVDDARERKPLANVARPVCVNVPRTVSAPICAACA